MSLKKTILITGCSSGFGMLTAARLAAKGHQVYATMRDVSKSKPLLTEVKKRGGDNNLKIIPLDVTKPETILAAVQHISAQEKKIDVLINNAGFGIGGFFEDLSDDDYRAQFDVNFFGVLAVTRAVLPLMRGQKTGKVINVTSLASFSGTPAFSAYASSKWALEGFSECLYMELKPLGIDVAVVEPGSYRTKIFEDNARYAKYFHDPQSPYYRISRHLRKLLDDHVRKNKRDPEEVAKVLERLVEARNMPFRNIIGFRSYLRYKFVRNVPFKMYAWLVNKVLLPRKD
ncbi:MAG: SDR family oxidoreductase [Candidatus Omnitrophica bacterium]|nr:SDR family oxidoreductase [Candidatus Omnitrophota bacterium]